MRISFGLLCLRPRREGGIIKWPRVSVLLSVRPSVCGVPRHNSRTKMPMKPKIGRMEAHHTGIPWTYLEVKRSKVKVNRPINAYTVNAQNLQKRKAYELQTWYTDGRWRSASQTRAVTSKFKVSRSRDALQVSVDKSRTKRPRNIKLGRKVFHPTGNNAHQFNGQRQRSRSPGRHNVETGSASYLLNGKAYELQTWYIDGGRRPASPTSAVTSIRSIVKVARSRDAFDRCWPINREQNDLETSKLTGQLFTPRAIMRNSFKVKGQGHQTD